MKRLQLVSQGTLSRMRQDAQIAWEQRDLGRCIEILERMNRLNPGDSGILIQLGRMHGLLYKYDLAEKFFERGVQVAPPEKKAEVLAQAGQQARDFSRSDLAEKYFKRALGERNAPPEVFVKLAEFCERRRRTDEAMAYLDRALERKTEYHYASYVKARLYLRAGQLREAEELLNSLLGFNVGREVRVRAWYELGQVLDRQERYPEAMNAFVQAKALLRSDGAPHLARRQMVLRQVAQMREQLSADLLTKWHKLGGELHPRRRLALLGGHPRSGTTLLEQIVDSHPDIVSIEETDHFSDYVGWPIQRRLPPGTPILQFLDFAPKEVILRCREDYFRAADLYLEQPVGLRLLVDKNPSLTMRVQDMLRAFPEIKFLIALRDPRDVVLSCFMQAFVPVQEVNSSFLSLDTAVDEYIALMSVWTSIAPMLPSPYLEVRYEDIVDDIEPVARRVLEFLEVPWDERVLGFDEHARQKRVRSPTYADVTQKIFKRARGRWRNYQKYLEPHLRKLEPFVKGFGYE